MGDHHHTIEINGKRIDAVTGAALSHPHKKVITVHDGSAPAPHARKSAHTKKQAAHAVHHKQSKSSTLMRAAVKKPHIMATASPIDEEFADFSARKALEELRIHRAKKVPTSRLVSRFGIPEVTDLRIKPTHADIPVRKAPAHTTPAKKPQHHTKTAHKPTHHDHFAAQLDKATAHTAKPLKKHHAATQRRRVRAAAASASMVAVAVFVLGGYFAYQNAAMVSARIAARQAGLAINVPGYTPAGFRLKSHNLQPGQISLNYGSNTDGRGFQLVETKSAIDGESIPSTMDLGANFQTISSKGRLVYLYNGSSATWVDQGTWYKLEGDAQLSAQQLQKIVDSI